MQLPPVGTRVALRYRLPPGSVPPLTDVIGHLLAAEPRIRLQTKTSAVVEISPDDVVAVKALTAAPVRTSQIRATEYAAALAWPGIERQWLNGWLLRAAGGHTHRGNSVVPLGVEADVSALPSIVDWYGSRGLTPWLSVPDRLLRLPGSVEPQLETVVMVRDLAAGEPDAAVTLTSEPDEAWLQLYRRDVPVDVLTAVVDGQVVFASISDSAVGRAAVTEALDGGRWVGMSAVRVAEEQRRRGQARTLCSSLLAWGFQRGATHAYVQVLVDNTAGITLYDDLGFVVQHRSRYIDARSL
jgi:ribosomal protein S18 acetylase RimI-like enzyme